MLAQQWEGFGGSAVGGGAVVRELGCESFFGLRNCLSSGLLESSIHILENYCWTMSEGGKDPSPIWGATA